MISLSDILNDPRFSYLKVLNFNPDFDRIVQTIDSTETPDVEMYLKPKTLLLTTGMVYQNNQQELISLIQGLNRADCSGLLIKLGRFVSKLDPKVLEMANALNFPIIQIPLEKTLGDVYSHLLSYIWDNQNEQLTYAFNIQKTFHDLLLQGADSQDLLETLGDMFKVDVALINPFNQLEAKSTKTLRNFSEKSLINLIEDKPSNTPYASILTDKKGLNHHVVIEPVNLNKSYPYYLIVIDPSKLAYPVSSLAIDQVILSLAFILNRDLSLNYHLLRDKEKFFNNLMDSDNFDASLMLSLGEMYGLKEAQHYQIITMNIDAPNRNLRESVEWFTLIYDEIVKLVKPLLLFPNRSQLQISFIAQDVDQSKVLNILKSIYHYIKDNLDIHCEFGIGNSVNNLNQLDNSYRESLHALEFGDKVNDSPYIWLFSSLNFESLIHDVDQQKIIDYCHYLLKDLMKPENQELRQTLKIWLDYNQDYTLSARKLYIHRNTVRYRIERCKEILDNELDDPSNLFEIQFALRLLN